MDDTPKSAIEKLLRIFGRIELVLGVLFGIRMLVTGNNDWGVLYVMLLFVAINGVFVLFALGVLLLNPPLRPKAWPVALMPFGFLLVPIMVRNAMGGPLSLKTLLIVGVAGAVIGLLWAVMKPGRARNVLPTGLLRSRWLNRLIVGAVALGWLVPVGVLVFLGTQSGTGQASGESPGMGVAVLALTVGMYFVVLGLVSAFAAAWGLIGFRMAQAAQPRGLYVWQMLLSVPGVIVGTLVWGWLRAQSLA